MIIKKGLKNYISNVIKDRRSIYVWRVLKLIKLDFPISLLEARVDQITRHTTEYHIGRGGSTLAS